MIDAIDLFLIEHGSQELVQRMSAFQILSKWFLHHYARAFCICANIQRTELYSYTWHQLRRHGHIKYHIGMLAKLGFFLLYDFSNALVFFFMVHVELEIADMFGEFRPLAVLFIFAARIFADSVEQVLAELF